MSVVGVVNWTKSIYQESTQAATQHFNAKGGRAGWQFTFHGSGDVLIEAFEGDSKVVFWSKRIRVPWRVEGKSSKKTSGWTDSQDGLTPEATDFLVFPRAAPRVFGSKRMPGRTSK